MYHSELTSKFSIHQINILACTAHWLKVTDTACILPFIYMGLLYSIYIHHMCTTQNWPLSLVSTKLIYLHACIAHQLTLVNGQYKENHFNLWVIMAPLYLTTMYTCCTQGNLTDLAVTMTERSVALRKKFPWMYKSSYVVKTQGKRGIIL